MAPRTDLLRGTLDVLILQSLSTGELHGLGVARRIEQLTGGAFEVGAGSLFPALHRLEESGWVAAEWGDSENNRRAKVPQAHGERTPAPEGRDQQLVACLRRDGPRARARLIVARTDSLVLLPRWRP